MGKLDEAKALVRKYLPLVKAGKMEESEMNRNIMEEVEPDGCSRTTVWTAKKKVEAEQPSAKKAEAPQVEIVDEAEKKPEFLPEREPEAIEEIKPVEEIAAPPLAPELEGQIEVFRDMMRGLYVLLLSKETLGEKYGKPREQCVQCADQLYRWLTRRIDPEDLERYDTVLLVGSHIALIAPIVVTFAKERREKLSSQKKKEKP